MEEPRAEELIVVFIHHVINLYFTANKSTMYTSFFDRVSPVCLIRHFFPIPLRWRIRQILLYLGLRGDKFRDLKNESTTLNFKKQNCNSFFIHPNLLHLSKTSFEDFARDSAVDAKKKIFRPIRVIDFFWHKLGLHFEPAR